jgi:hypothetical protein
MVSPAEGWQMIRWWQFWHPESGAPGGAIAGLVLCIIYFAVVLAQGYVMYLERIGWL